MIDPEIQKLLSLQERDAELIRLEKELENLPIERHKIKVEIEMAEAKMEEERQELMQLEVRRKDLENEVGLQEDLVTKYKNQQIYVKKNDEYQALTHEIENATTRIGELEEEEIGLMLQIDEEAEKFKLASEKYKKQIESLRSDVEKKNDRQRDLEAKRGDLENDVERLRGEVSAPFIRAYDTAKKNLRFRPPFVAPIENGICKRSNLRVANDLLTEAREHGSPHFDSDTGCLVYIP